MVPLEVPVIRRIAQNGVERLVGEGKFRGIADNVGEDTGVDVLRGRRRSSCAHSTGAGI